MRTTRPGGRPENGGTGGEPHVYRPVLPRALVGLVAVIGVWWVADMVTSGRWAQAAVAAAWFTAGVAALAALFWRPAVVVDDDGAELRNVLRDVRVPWPLLEAVETRFALTLVASGRRHQSWAGAARGRPARRRPSEWGRPARAAGRAGDEAADRAAEQIAVSRDPRSPSGITALMVEQRWEAWRLAVRRRRVLAEHGRSADAGPEPDHAEAADVVVRWRPLLPAIAVVAALVALGLSSALG